MAEDKLTPAAEKPVWRGNADRCQRCGAWLNGDIEFDIGICGDCADTLYEIEQERREWEYYHND